MPPKKELCRNFQRGSCRYGDRCKFLHAPQQQPKSNPFGFGLPNGPPFQSTTPQQQNQNPFGFGVKTGTQLNGGTNFGRSTQASLFKPFENKWSRNASGTGSSSATSQQNRNQSQASNHICNDPDSCKRLIVEDLEHEQPLWKLTCYGHFKHLPCDITGDTSYEELRAAAYDDAKCGIKLQSIVERERNLHQGKLLEFENLLRSPYTVKANPAQATTNPFSSVVSTSLAPQNNVQSPDSGFGQVNTSLNMGFSMRPPTPTNNPFGQFSDFMQTLSPSVPHMASGHTVPFGGQNSTQTGQGLFNSSSGSNPPVMPAFQNVSSSTNNQPQMLLNGFGSHSSGAGQTIPAFQSINNSQEENSVVDASIWLKGEWKLGEIPEEIPPYEYVK